MKQKFDKSLNTYDINGARPRQYDEHIWGTRDYSERSPKYEQSQLMNRSKYDLQAQELQKQLKEKQENLNFLRNPDFFNQGQQYKFLNKPKDHIYDVYQKPNNINPQQIQQQYQKQEIRKEPPSQHFYDYRSSSQDNNIQLQQQQQYQQPPKQQPQQYQQQVQKNQEQQQQQQTDNKNSLYQYKRSAEPQSQIQEYHILQSPVKHSQQFKKPLINDLAYKNPHSYEDHISQKDFKYKLPQTSYQDQLNYYNPHKQLPNNEPIAQQQQQQAIPKEEQKNQQQQQQEQIQIKDQQQQQQNNDLETQLKELEEQEQQLKQRLLIQNQQKEQQKLLQQQQKEQEEEELQKQKFISQSQVVQSNNSIQQPSHQISQKAQTIQNQFLENKSTIIPNVETREQYRKLQRKHFNSQSTRALQNMVSKNFENYQSQDLELKGQIARQERQRREREELNKEIEKINSKIDPALQDELTNEKKHYKMNQHLSKTNRLFPEKDLTDIQLIEQQKFQEQQHKFQPRQFYYGDQSNHYQSLQQQQEYIALQQPNPKSLKNTSTIKNIY